MIMRPRVRYAPIHLTYSTRTLIQKREIEEDIRRERLWSYHPEKIQGRQQLRRILARTIKEFAYVRPGSRNETAAVGARNWFESDEHF